MTMDRLLTPFAPLPVSGDGRMWLVVGALVVLALVAHAQTHEDVRVARAWRRA